MRAQDQPALSDVSYSLVSGSHVASAVSLFFSFPNLPLSRTGHTARLIAHSVDLHAFCNSSGHKKEEPTSFKLRMDL